MAIQKSSAPTIIDVAELAGVSRATASRAMGGYGRIAVGTVEQVRKAAAQMRLPEPCVRAAPAPLAS
jgi:LacI family transcriptional regulator